MFIRKVKNKYKGKEYINYQLVESVRTQKGPRHKVVCALGNLAPRKPEEWLKLARRVEDTLAGQADIFEEADEEVKRVVAMVNDRKEKVKVGENPCADDVDLVSVRTELVRVEECREAGSVHVGHQFWKRLGLDKILSVNGFSGRAAKLACAMTMNRLVSPSSEHAMPDWIRRTALSDILGEDFSTLSEDPLYRNLDVMHAAREPIEKSLSGNEESIFNLPCEVLLYDLTSTYFEGAAEMNPKAKRGYSRDKRPDCKQVVVGLVIGAEGFPAAHEVFDGNTQDRSSLGHMLEVLERRSGPLAGRTVVVDRGMAFEENLSEITGRGMHYLVAGRQSERNEFLDEFEDMEGFSEVIREPSPLNPCQKKTRVLVKRHADGNGCVVLCLSDGRSQKDRAIREKQEKRLLADLARLQERVASGSLRKSLKIGEAIGRLKERYPRVSRYYSIGFDEDKCALVWTLDQKRRSLAEELDGAYMLKTDRADFTAEDAWRTYSLLTRAENAFRSMKSPLSERPIFHRLEHRVEAHIFLCVLAYHILNAVELTLRRAGMHTSWATIRDTLSSHQICTVVLPAENGDTLRIRKASTPEKTHREIYGLLGMDPGIIRPKRSWSRKATDDL